MKTFILTFSFVDFQDLTCIEQAEDSGSALRSIMGVWGPPAEITGVVIKQVELMSVNIHPRKPELEAINDGS